MHNIITKLTCNSDNHLIGLKNPNYFSCDNYNYANAKCAAETLPVKSDWKTSILNMK